MGKSTTATLVLFLASLATVASIAAFYAMSAAAGWAFGAASASLAVVSVLVCIALGSVSYVRYRRSKPAQRFSSRLNDIGLPPRPDDQSRTANGIEHPTADESLNDRIARIQAIDDDQTPVSTPEPQVVDPDLVPPEPDTVARIHNREDADSASQPERPSIELVLTQSEDLPTAQPQPEPSSPPGPAQAARVSGRGFRPDPKQLAAVLNLYEHTGFPPNGHFDGTMPENAGTHQAPESRSLWAELVGEYGAESFDLRDAETGQCQITLTTGDIVFYSPERRSWLWIAFEKSGPIPSSLTDALSLEPTGISSH